MNVLSTSLRAKIESRPTNTLLRSQNSTKDIDTHIQLIKSSHTPKDHIKVPLQFDGRVVWKGLLVPPQNQGSCGSCWAFASTGSLADRFNIQSMGLMHVRLSAAKVILCDIKGSGFIKHPEKQLEIVALKQSQSNKTSACFGNTLADAWKYLFTTGTNTEKCVPYNSKIGIFKEFEGLGSFTTTEKMPTCTAVTGILGDMCSDFTYNEITSEETGTPARFYRVLHYYAIAGIPNDGGSELYIRYNIFKWGPVSTSFAVYPDFYTFDTNKIYEWDGNGYQVGGHAVEIVGWGEENNKKYWIIKNSWGINWGDKGYFKFVRGNNNCQLEENVITGVPDYFYPLTYDVPFNGIIWSESREAIEERRKNWVDLKSFGGGVDPTTGYTFRSMVTKAWVDLDRPVKLENLPDYTIWVAGIDASTENTNNDYEPIYTVLLIVLLIITIIYIIYIQFFRRNTNH